MCTYNLSQIKHFIKHNLFSWIRKKDICMKNTKKNQLLWLEKVKETLEIVGKSNATYVNYRCQLNHFFHYFDENTNLEKLTEEDLASYLKKEYIDKNTASATMNLAICSIRFLFSICFDKELNRKKLPNHKIPKRIPTIISKEQFISLFNNTNNLEHKCWLILAFCSGLRAEEIATLKIENIYSHDHKLKVLGKGTKERFTILPDVVIKYLRLYCKKKQIKQKSGYLFTGDYTSPHIASKTIVETFIALKKKNNLNNAITLHSLRHSFATYYLMNGGNIITLKSLLGHTSLNTTSIYIHIAQNFNELEGIKYV